MACGSLSVRACCRTSSWTVARRHSTVEEHLGSRMHQGSAVSGWSQHPAGDSMDTSQRINLVAVMSVLATAALAACAVDDGPPSVEPSRVSGHLLAVQSAPPASINILPAPVGEIVLSERGCFALRSRPDAPALVIYAPYGSTITPDGQGFTYEDTTLYLGDQLNGFAGSFLSFRNVANPSQSLRECRPKKVVELW